MPDVRTPPATLLTQAFRAPWLNPMWEAYLGELMVRSAPGKPRQKATKKERDHDATDMAMLGYMADGEWRSSKEIAQRFDLPSLTSVSNRMVRFRSLGIIESRERIYHVKGHGNRSHTEWRRV